MTVVTILILITSVIGVLLCFLPYFLGIPFITDSDGRIPLADNLKDPGLKLNISFCLGISVTVMMELIYETWRSCSKHTTKLLGKLWCLFVLITMVDVLLYYFVCPQSLYRILPPLLTSKYILQNNGVMYVVCTYGSNVFRPIYGFMISCLVNLVFISWSHAGFGYGLGIIWVNQTVIYAVVVLTVIPLFILCIKWLWHIFYVQVEEITPEAYICTVASGYLIFATIAQAVSKLMYNTTFWYAMGAENISFSILVNAIYLVVVVGLLRQVRSQEKRLEDVSTRPCFVL